MQISKLIIVWRSYNGNKGECREPGQLRLIACAIDIQKSNNREKWIKRQ